jgi:hypothetical protein
MRKLILVAIAAMALLATASLTNRADAMTIGNPVGLRGAIDDIAVTDQVHCRWGWQHHRWRYGYPTWDGCYRGYRYGGYAPLYYGGYAPLYIGPRVYIGPRYRYRAFRRW